MNKSDVLQNLEQVKKWVEEAQAEQPKEKKKINITIRNRWTGSIIFESEKTTYREALREAIDTRANITDTDLTGANLTGADLSDADLTRANLSDTDLTDTNLTGANLTRADLSDADLSDADLTRADLTRADLTRADLNACLFYMGAGNRNFEALCKAIKTIKHQDGTFDQLSK